MQRKRTRIIVIGTSAGGLEALDQLIGQLPQKFPASIFIVQHLTLDNSGEPLVRRLLRHRAFDVRLARNGDRFASGRIYIAPPDHHLLLKRGRMLVPGARARTATGLASILCFVPPRSRIVLSSSA